MITVTLSAEEVRERGQELAQCANKLIELQEEEEDLKASYKTKMADVKERRLDISSQMRRLSRAVRLGVEERNEQRVLFDEEKRLEEFRREREAEAAELAEKAVELISQQQQKSNEAVKEFFDDEERERLHKEAVANWRREKPWEKAFCACGHVHVALGCSEDDCECEDFKDVCPDDEIEAKPDDVDGTPFPTERSQEDINHMAEYYAAQEIAEGKRARICHVDGQPHVITGGVGSGDAKNWASVKAWPVLPLENIGEENAKTYKQASDEYYKRIEDGDPHKPLDYTGVKINCGSKKYPKWWVMVGPEMRFTVDYSAAHPDNEIEAKADEFTAPRCDECGRIDGGHAPTCSQSDTLTYDDYFRYSQAHGKGHHASHARKMDLKRDPKVDAKVREWKQQQAGDGPDNEPKPKKRKSKKLSPVEAAIDR